MSNAWPGASCIMWESVYCSIAVSLIPIAFACNYNYSYAGLFLPDPRLLSAEVILGRSKPWFIRFSMIKIESILKHSGQGKTFFYLQPIWLSLPDSTAQSIVKAPKKSMEVEGSKNLVPETCSFWLIWFYLHSIQLFFLHHLILDWLQ